MIDENNKVEIQGWRVDTRDNFSTPCSVDDARATSFEIRHPWQTHQSNTIRFDSLLVAQQVQRAIAAAFKAGGRYKMAKLREFLEV